MTTILNESIAGTIDSTLEKINITGDMKVSTEGVLLSIQSGMVYDTTSSVIDKKYIGSYNVSNDMMDPSSDKRSISINISDITKMSAVTEAILACLKDIEDKYKPTV